MNLGSMARRLMSRQPSAEHAASNATVEKLLKKLADRDGLVEKLLEKVANQDKQLKDAEDTIENIRREPANSAFCSRPRRPSGVGLARVRVSAQAAAKAREKARQIESESEEDIVDPKAEPNTAPKTRKRRRVSSPSQADSAVCPAQAEETYDSDSDSDCPPRDGFSAHKQARPSFRHAQTTPTRPLNHSYSLTPASKKRKPVPLYPPIIESEPFKFTFIVAYDSPTHEKFSYYKSKDFSRTKDLVEIFDLVSLLQETWEAAAGAEWQYEFTQPKFKSRKRVCVATKLAKRRTYWRRDDDGNFACRECAATGRPCFTWDGKFYCLPLHENDRKLPVEKDKEVRYWINEYMDGATRIRAEKQNAKTSSEASDSDADDWERNYESEEVENPEDSEASEASDSEEDLEMASGDDLDG